MTWLRMELTQERRRIVNEERSAHPNPRIRERMLVVRLLRNGTTRQYARRGSSESVGPPFSDRSPRFVRGAWMARVAKLRSARKARWPHTAS